MTQDKISEDIKNLKDLPGMARGQTIKNALQSILVMEGEEGLAKLEKKMKELGCWEECYSELKVRYNEFPIRYKEFKKIRSFDWYPLWYDLVPIIVAAEIFNWDEERIKEFGRNNQKISFFEKVLLKYFVSPERTFKAASGRWKIHYSVGELESVEFSEREKYLILRLKNFSGHPTFCKLLTGYFEAAASFVVASEKVKGKETKCTFRGDPYHEYLISWE